jgi:hypothetical protein
MSGVKKVLTILLAVLFVVSLTAVAVSAHGGGWGGYPLEIYGYPYGAYGGVPYMTGQYPPPETSNQAPNQAPNQTPNH